MLSAPEPEAPEFVRERECEGEGGSGKFARSPDPLASSWAERLVWVLLVWHLSRRMNSSKCMNIAQVLMAFMTPDCAGLVGQMEGASSGVVVMGW